MSEKSNAKAKLKQESGSNLGKELANQTGKGTEKKPPVPPPPTPVEGKTAKWASSMKPEPEKQVPYNGLEIVGIPYFYADKKFLYVKLTFTDYTNSPKGIISTIAELTSDEGIVAIPKPAEEAKKSDSQKADSVAGTEKKDSDTENPLSEEKGKPKKSGDKSAAKFTVDGTVYVKKYTSGILVRVRFYFGLEPKRHELGSIFVLEPKPRKKRDSF